MEPVHPLDRGRAGRGVGHQGQDPAARRQGDDLKPGILCCDAGREFRWNGKLVLPGVFDGEHYFQLAADGAGSTVFTHGERFTGLLVPLLRGTLERDIRASCQRPP